MPLFTISGALISLERIEAVKNNPASLPEISAENEASVLAWVDVAELLDDLTIVFYLLFD
jgi:hypothetical protein